MGLREGTMSRKCAPTEDLERLAKEASDWVASPEGQRGILETLKRAKEITNKLEEAHRPDPRSLYVPFTL